MALSWRVIPSTAIESAYATVTASSFDSGIVVAALAVAKDVDIIRMRGRLRTTTGFTNNGRLFRIPGGFRPATSHLLAAIASGGAAQGVDILATGEVIFRRSGVTGSLDLSFDGLWYPAGDP